MAPVPLGDYPVYHITIQARARYNKQNNNSNDNNSHTVDQA